MTGNATEAGTTRIDAGGALARAFAERPDPPAAPWSGRGIVICAGGVQIFTNAWVLISVLRKALGCRLPIEVWHFGPEEMSSGMRDMLEGLDATAVDASAVLSRFPARITDGWQLKAYALIMSAFREVLLLDADNVPLIDPALLFERPEYAESGAIFWPDIMDIAESNPIWAECGLPAERRASFETGQMLVDKARHRAALKMTLCLNEEAERLYKLIYGDKDTFLVAWHATQSAFSLVPHRPFVDRYLILQRDFYGDVIFQHRTNAKWRYFGDQIWPGAFLQKAACQSALTELRRIWNGRIFEPPARSLAARRMERQMEGRLFVATCPGEPDRELELLVGNQIGSGRDFDREAWHIAEPEPGRFALRIMDRHQVRYELHRQDDESWVELGSPDAGMGLTPADAVAGGAVARDLGLVRDLVGAVVAHGGWADDVAAELRIALTALCKVDPRLADDVAAFATADGALDAAARAGILDIAVELKRAAAGASKRRSVRSPPGVLYDPALYVRL